MATDTDTAPLFQRHTALEFEGLQLAVNAGLDRESGLKLPRERLLGELETRVQGLLSDNRDAADWKERLVALFWYASLPIYTKAAAPRVISGPFWLFEPGLVDAETVAAEDPTMPFFVKTPVVGFNFFLREVVFEDTAYLTLRLQRAEPFKRVSLLNLTPVLGASFQTGYAQLKSSATRADLEGVLPAGLLLSEGE